MVGAQQPTMSVIAAKAATSTMPIVYMSNDDPRKYGLVFSLQKLKTRVGRQIFRLFHQVPYDGTTWNMDPSPLQQLGPNFSHHTFSSAANGGVEIGYAVAVPNSYATSPNRRYPVIYALHGITMDEVSIATYYARSVFNIAGTADIIWVFPNGGRNSKFIDAVPGSPMFGVEMAESAIINELIPAVDAAFRTIPDQRHRFITGVSMGGAGSLRLAFRHPHLFAGVYPMCAAIDDNSSNIAAEEPDLLANMLGGNASLFDPLTIQVLAQSNKDKIIASGIKIHGQVGDQDRLMQLMQQLWAEFDSLGIPHGALDILQGIGHTDVILMTITEPSAWAIAISGGAQDSTRTQGPPGPPGRPGPQP